MLSHKQKFYLSIIMFALFSFTMISGIVIWFLPKKLFGHAIFLGITKYHWKVIHVFTGLLLTISVCIHIVDHWRYFRSKLFK